MEKENHFLSASDFLNNEDFIAWRLFRLEQHDCYWNNFINENPEAAPLLREACRKFDAVKLNKAKLNSSQEEELYSKIKLRINTHKLSTKKRRQVVWLSAAACVIVLVASLLLLKVTDKKISPNNQNEIIGNSLPSETVRLLVGEKVMSLQSNASINVSRDGSVSVTDSTQKTKTLRLAEKQTSKLIVPYGKRSFITLSDGTKVWLNSGTELEFETKFNGQTREIRVKGEIYLEVAKSSEPFVIHTGQSLIRVLGTEFNISAYAEDKVESVVLVKGSVQIEAYNNKNIRLTPHEMAIITAEAVSKKHVNVSEHISWRNGVIEFNKTSMADVLRKIGRYYNVSFEDNINAQLNNKTVSGKLFLSNKLDSVMTSFSTLSSTHYTREKNKIIIRKK